MNKITFKNYYFLWITLFFLVSNNVTSQILPCVVHENVSAYSSNTFGQPQTTFAIPNNYPITPKKFRIKFWKVQAISDSLKVKVNNDSV